MGDFLGVFIVIGLVFATVYVLGLDAGEDSVEAGVGRTFQCEKVDAVKVDGEYLKGEACRAVDK